MIPIAGRPLVENTLANMRAAGCDQIIVIVGHMRDAIQIPDVLFVENKDYLNTNILHSLMYARAHLEGAVICSYSDIWVEPPIYRTLTETPGDIVLAVDRDWRPYYEGRLLHPTSEAENVIYGSDGLAYTFGKGLSNPMDSDHRLGEFLGLWKMSAEGTKVMRDCFTEIDARLGRDEPFQRARAWRNAYVTDMLQELTNRGQSIRSALIERGWAELDTLEDVERLESIAGRQNLVTFTQALQSV